MAISGVLRPVISPPSNLALASVFAAPKKRAVIVLRWPLVIICSYLLAYSGDGRAADPLVNGLAVLYIASNCLLYLLRERTFDSPYFYAPLVIFDTFILTMSLSYSGQAAPDFYLACFFTIFLCCVCQDFRGLVGMAALGSLIYGYALLRAAGGYDANILLRIPVPFIVAIFYGYFVQVEKVQKTAAKEEQRLLQQKEAEEQLQRQLPRIAILHEIDIAVNSTLDLRAILTLLLQKVENYLPYFAATTVRIPMEDSGSMELVICRNLDQEQLKSWEPEHTLVRMVMRKREPVTLKNIRRQILDSELSADQDLVSYLGLPLISKGETVGVLSIYTKKEEHEFGYEEISFLNAIANNAAIAIHNAKLYEKIKHQAVELEEANKVKDEFLGFMSHELRTPITAIVGYTNMVRDKLLGEVSQRQEAALGKVLALANDVLDMISAVLHAASVRQPASLGSVVKAERKETDLGDFLDELRSAYAVPLGKDVVLNWQYPAQLPAIQADSVKLKHILQNLVNNALKFTDHGSVTVAVQYFPERGVVEFEVSDTGVGIPDEALPVIFEMFHKVDGPTTRPREGVGLGLHIVKNFVQMLGGTINVKSEPGKGSAFIVTLPVGNSLREETDSPSGRPIVELTPELSSRRLDC